jgi:hypothetical protein
MCRWVTLVLALAVCVWAREVLAVEPWSDADPEGPPERLSTGDFGARVGAEYRANFLYINPINLSSETDRRVSWIEHRLRFDFTGDWQDKVRVVTSVDALDGTLWGDNGSFDGDPAKNSGTNVDTKNPNDARPCVGVRNGGDPLQASSYGYTLCDGNPLFIRKAYGEVLLPVGLLRVGRQSVNVGTGVQAADGDGRPNRFGFSRTGNIVDRVLFATKPLEALKPPELRDRDENHGLVWALVYDRVVTDDPMYFGSNVHQAGTAFRYGADELGPLTDGLAQVYYVHRWDYLYDTAINALGARSFAHLGDFYGGFDFAFNFGTTREVSEAYRFLTNDPAVDQPVRQMGARVVVRYDRPLFSAYLELDYASGNPDPTTRQPLTQYSFAPDTNVGLLLFKHILDYQTARSAAAGVETLRRLGATTFPAAAVATQGAFTNAVAIFPQFDVTPSESWLFRGGVLVAWAAAPVNDPIASLEAYNGININDHMVNFAGGKPASYYGTELDGRIRYRFEDHFNLDLEGAILFPGAALEDENHQAVRSVLLQARTTFFF